MKPMSNWEEVLEKKENRFIWTPVSHQIKDLSLRLNQIQSTKKKIVKKLDYCTLKKSVHKSKIKAPPSVPLLPQLDLSPNKIARQHIPQVSKQPTFSLSVTEDSSRGRATLHIPSKNLARDKKRSTKVIPSIISNRTYISNLPAFTSTSSCTSSQSVDQDFSNEESGEYSYASVPESNINAESMSIQNEFNNGEAYLEVTGN